MTGIETSGITSTIFEGTEGYQRCRARAQRTRVAARPYLKNDPMRYEWKCSGVGCNVSVRLPPGQLLFPTCRSHRFGGDSRARWEKFIGGRAGARKKTKSIKSTQAQARKHVLNIVKLLGFAVRGAPRRNTNTMNDVQLVCCSYGAAGG